MKKIAAFSLFIVFIACTAYARVNCTLSAGVPNVRVVYSSSSFPSTSYVTWEEYGTIYGIPDYPSTSRYIVYPYHHFIPPPPPPHHRFHRPPPPIHRVPPPPRPRHQ